MQLILLWNYLRKGKRIVHAHLPRAQLMAALAGSFNPIVSSRHDAEPFFHDAPKLVSRLLALLVDFRSSKQIAISKVVRDGMVERKEVFKNSEIAVIHYGFETLPLTPPLIHFRTTLQRFRRGRLLLVQPEDWFTKRITQPYFRVLLNSTQFSQNPFWLLPGADR